MSKAKPKKESMLVVISSDVRAWVRAQAEAVGGSMSFQVERAIREKMERTQQAEHA
jgi:hypothetical protein